MRLIDADEILVTAIEERRFVWHTHDFPSFEEVVETVYSDLKDFIEAQPTAYDADAVVRELEELAKLHARHQLKCEVKGMDYCADRHEHKVQALDEAIAIVKRGGRNELQQL